MFYFVQYIPLAGGRQGKNRQAMTRNSNIYHPTSTRQIMPDLSTTKWYYLREVDMTFGDDFDNIEVSQAR